jgi:hypothetical protein
MVDKAPSEDKLLQRSVRQWEPTKHTPMLTASRSAFKTFNTFVCDSLCEICCRQLLIWYVQDEAKILGMEADGGLQRSMKQRRNDL